MSPRCASLPSVPHWSRCFRPLVRGNGSSPAAFIAVAATGCRVAAALQAGQSNRRCVSPSADRRSDRPHSTQRMRFFFSPWNGRWLPPSESVLPGTAAISAAGVAGAHACARTEEKSKKLPCRRRNSLAKRADTCALHAVHRSSASRNQEEATAAVSAAPPAANNASATAVQVATEAAKAAPRQLV